MINSIDEIKVIKTIRLFVGLISLISTLLEDMPMDDPILAYLTNNDVNKEKMGDLRMLKFATILNLIVLVFVQVRIEIFKKMVDNRNESTTNQITDEEACTNINFGYSNSTFRILLVVICLGFLSVLDWLFRVRGRTEDIFLGRLRIIIFSQFLVGNVIPMILIKRNPNMYRYCVKQFYLYFWWIRSQKM